MESKELMEAIVQILDSKKADDIRAIRIGDLTIIADYFVIAAGSSNTQVKMLADEVEYQLSQKGIKPMRPKVTVRKTGSCWIIPALWSISSCGRPESFIIWNVCGRMASRSISLTSSRQTDFLQICGGFPDKGMIKKHEQHLRFSGH